MSKIDLDELENKLQVITRWPLEDELYGDVLTPKVILELIRRLREAERDVGRYRWLRFADLDKLASDNWKDGEVFTGEEFDSAIDAAMSQEANK
jgi:hypothetical protein